VNAASDAYGGGSTALGLVATSVHPEQAGVQIELLETLLAHGAQIEGGQAGNDHGVVLGCLANGQPAAARFFADRGAPLNLVEAAGVGRLDRVRAFFDDRGLPHAEVAPGQIDSALQYAAGYGQPDVVTFLIDHGARVAMEDDAGQTPLHWATFGPHVEVTRMLLANGAPVNARDHRFNATPLDWMLHALATAEADVTRTRGREVVALLVAAGAVPDLDRFGAAIRSRLSTDADLLQALRLTPTADKTGGAS
jgi:ankyrin repeat protein